MLQRPFVSDKSHSSLHFVIFYMTSAIPVTSKSPMRRPPSKNGTGD